jgi:hypothetical protein
MQLAVPFAVDKSPSHFFVPAGPGIAAVAAERASVCRKHYLRVLARVLAHELYHILTQSENHADSGVAKAALSVADLTGSPFEFDGAALGLIQASRAAPEGK